MPCKTKKFFICLLLCLIFSFTIFAQQKSAGNSGRYDIVWDSASQRQVSFPEKKNANYARMIETGHDTLICVYETAGSIEATVSHDAGNSWQTPVTIVAKTDGVNMSVPDILQLRDHSLLVSYNPRPHKINGSWDTTKHFAICTIKSYDGGATWKDKRLLYEAGATFENGCWEPSAVQLPSGEIQLFFSNEGIYSQSNEQNISLLRSTDNGVTWSHTPEVVSFTPHHRDGMPVPIVLLPAQQVVFSIEDNAGEQFKPSVIRNSFRQNWQTTIDAKSAERTAALSVPLPDSVYAGAPFLRQLHNGNTVLSYQSTNNRSSHWEQSCMQVAMGDKEAKNFVPVAAPFEIPRDKHGLWNSLCILHDDTIIAITSTNAFTPNTAIRMIKGRLVTR